MLWYADKLRELSFRELMEVYVEGNCENAQDRYPELSEGEGLLHAEQDFYSYLHDVFFTTSGARYALWVENGKYISALRLEPYRDGLLLEALETLPLQRRKGYASMLIRAVQESNCGTIIYSHVNKSNVPSLKTHEKCGFRRISDHCILIDGSVNRYCCTLCWGG